MDLNNHRKSIKNPKPADVINETLQVNVNPYQNLFRYQNFKRKLEENIRLQKIKTSKAYSFNNDKNTKIAVDNVNYPLDEIQDEENLCEPKYSNDVNEQIDVMVKYRKSTAVVLTKTYSSESSGFSSSPSLSEACNKSQSSIDSYLNELGNNLVLNCKESCLNKKKLAQSQICNFDIDMSIDRSMTEYQPQVCAPVNRSSLLNTSNTTYKNNHLLETKTSKLMPDEKPANKVIEAEVIKETNRQNSSSRGSISIKTGISNNLNSLSKAYNDNKKEQYKTIICNTFYKQKESKDISNEGSSKIKSHNWNQEFHNLILGQEETFTIKESFEYMKRKLSQKGFISQESYEIGKVKDAITVTEDFDNFNFTQKTTLNTKTVKNTDIPNQIISQKPNLALDTILKNETQTNNNDQSSSSVSKSDFKNLANVQEEEFKRPKPVKLLIKSTELLSKINETNLTLHSQVSDIDASVIFKGFGFAENGKLQNLGPGDASIITLDESKSQVGESDESVIIISDLSKQSNISVQKEIPLVDSSAKLPSNFGPNPSETQLMKTFPLKINHKIPDESLILLSCSEDKAKESDVVTLFPKENKDNENILASLAEDLVENSIENFDLKRKIEKHVADILQFMCRNKIPYFSVPCYNRSSSASGAQNESVQVKRIFRTLYTTLSFIYLTRDSNNKGPSNFKMKIVKCHGRSIGHFSSMVYLLGQIYSLLISNSKCTKRELYYRNQELFSSQTVSDLALNDLSRMLNCPLWKMGILSSSKGLLAGDLKITNDKEVISYTRHKSSTVPNDLTNVQSIITEAKFILIVEKDTVFQRLIDDGIFEKLEKNMLLITGKGYSDLNTRRLLQKLIAKYNIPAYILVDADPHGVEIMLMYRFGSPLWAHEADGLICPNLNWVGVKPSDTLIFNIDHERLTEDDLLKLKSQLNRPYIPADIREEIEILIKSNHKSEIESLYKISPDYLIDEYLKNSLKLCNLENDDFM